MYLKELTISGFKSFAKKSELDFLVPITAIVGPNGSGKSNVAEAFRFVLGEQSVKSMRGKRGEDLIWGGSTQVSRGNRAGVLVRFDNTARTFDIDYDEVVLERVVHRDGQNEYKINSTSVRLKDVQALLAAANIGSTGHHIISQGEADRILSAAAVERREMIEDALGLKVYQYKKHEAVKKLEKTAGNIERVESLRREHAPHLKYLKKQVDRLQKSLAVQAELQQVYAEYLKREDVYLAFHYDRLQSARQAPVTKLAQVQKELETAKSTLREVAENGASNDRIASLEENLRAATRAQQTQLKHVSHIEGQITYITRRLSEQQHKTSTPEVVLSLSDYDGLVEEVEKKVEKAIQSEAVPQLRRALADIVHTLKMFTKQAVDIDSTVDADNLKAELVQLQAERTVALDQHAALLQAEKTAESEYSQARSAVESEMQSGRDIERIVFALTDEQRELEATIANIDRDLQVIERDRSDFKQEVQEAVALLQSAAAHYFTYEIVIDGQSVTNEEIAAEDRSAQRTRRRELEKLKIRLEELGQGATEEVLKEYQTAQEREEFLAREVADLHTAVSKLESLIQELNEQLHAQFVTGLDKITVEFNRFFVLMFGGGEAGLELVKPRKKKNDTEDGEEADEGAAEESGVELNISLPNKRVKGLDMLSGGERALTSIALLFAMSQVNPPPFIILDETDAALDEANSRRYGDMIEALAEKSQLILITHNRETMSRAGVLYGVTMGMDGVSKLLSVKLDEAVAVAK